MPDIFLEGVSGGFFTLAQWGLTFFYSDLSFFTVKIIQSNKGGQSFFLHLIFKGVGSCYLF